MLAILAFALLTLTGLPQGKVMDDAGARAREAVATAEKEHGPDHLETAKALKQLGAVLYVAGRASEAKGPILRAITIFTKLEANDHLPSALLHSGAIHQQLGDLDAARTAFEQSLAAAERTLPAGQSAVAAAVNSLGVLDLTLGQFASARKNFERALAIWAESKAAPLTFVAMAENNLAATLSELGDVATARHHAEAAVAKMIEAKPAGSSGSWMIGWFRSNLGSVYFNLGMYELARATIERAIAELDASVSAQHFRSAEARIRLAWVSLAQYAAPEAIRLITDALPVLQGQLGPRHELVIQGHAALSTAYRFADEPARALDEARTTTQLWLETRGPNHPSTVCARQTEIEALLAVNNFGDAARVAKDLVPDHERIFGVMHATTAAACFWAANVAWKQGDDGGAEALFTRALSIWETCGLGSNDQALRTRLMLAIAKWLTGDNASALALLERNLRETSRALTHHTAALIDAKRLWLVAQHRFNLHMLLSIAARSGMDAARQHTAIVAFKDQLTRGVTQSRAWLRRRHDATAIEIEARLQRVLEDMAGFAVSNGDPMARQERLAAERDELLRRLSSMTATALGGETRDDETAPAWQSSLDADAVFIDFVCYWDVSRRDAVDAPPRSRFLDSVDGDLETKYQLAAFVIAKGATTRRIELGSVAEVEAALRSYSALIARSTGPADAVTKKALQRATTAVMRFWKPLGDAIRGAIRGASRDASRDVAGDAKRIFICPDGPIASLPFAALPGPDGDFLVEHYEFVQIPSAYTLAEKRRPAPSFSALLVGDVDFAAINGATSSERSAARPKAFHALPESAHEVEAIARLATEGEVEILRGRDVTKAKLREAVVGKAVVHFATHGYFVPDPGASRFLDALKSLSGGIDMPSSPEHLSGLGGSGGIALSGANSGAPTDCLTIDEAAWLDLSAAELVVLSACQSGLGHAVDGDQMMGLRRSLRLAGARRSLTTLWRVDDAATRRLIVDFYRRHVTDGLEVARALREAQLTMLRQNRSEHGDPMPGTWGALLVEGR